MKKIAKKYPVLLAALLGLALGRVTKDRVAQGQSQQHLEEATAGESLAVEGVMTRANASLETLAREARARLVREKGFTEKTAIQWWSGKNDKGQPIQGWLVQDFGLTGPVAPVTSKE